MYCQAESDGPFPAEHVLPKMFGKFENNLTLDCVCGRCNNAFSKLELSFGRDSAEAIERLRRGLKPMKEAEEVGRQRMRNTFLDQPGSHEGSRITFTGEGHQLGGVAAPQVGFRKGDAKPIWVDEDELTEERVARFRNGYALIVLGPTDESITHLDEKLKSLGFTLADPEALEPPVPAGEPLDVVTEYSLDDVMMRVVAKVAFNYATWTAGSDFMLGQDFNAMREFILDGKKPPWDPVIPKAESILRVENAELRRENVHLLGMRWNQKTKSLLGQVSFFNKFNYWIALCLEYEGIWHPAERLHSFNLKSRKARSLVPTE